jgi:hypothetical protein
MPQAWSAAAPGRPSTSGNGRQIATGDAREFIGCFTERIRRSRPIRTSWHEWQRIDVQDRCKFNLGTLPT